MGTRKEETTNRETVMFMRMIVSSFSYNEQKMSKS